MKYPAEKGKDNVQVKQQSIERQNEMFMYSTLKQFPKENRCPISFFFLFDFS